MIGPVETIRAFALTLWRSRAGPSRPDFLRWQDRAVAKWVRNSAPQVAFYDGGKTLSELPITDKDTVMGQFSKFNIAGLTADAAWEIQHRGGRDGDLTVGASTGTSGNRGLFVISEREKHRWLGTIVAKTMADLVWKPQRVAIIMPQDTGLYGSANTLRFIRLQTFSLQSPLADWRAELEAFDPTIIVAPPKVLRHFAEQNYTLSPVRIFSAAEALDPIDARVITAYFGQPLRQIYMATEGLFAVSCAKGGLHLAEDCVAFEFEDAGGGLVSPLVTNFRRDTQIMARYRMNDLLRLADAPCPCGSPLQAVAEVVGRADDIFVFDVGGAQVAVTPDLLRNTVLDADRRVTDFRVIQTTQTEVVLQLPPTLGGSVLARAAQALQTLLDKFGTGAQVRAELAVLPLDTSRKLRRVERRCRHD